MLLSVGTISAADVSGKWSGALEFINAEGQTGSTPAFLILKQKGEDFAETPCRKMRRAAGHTALQLFAPEGGMYEGMLFADSELNCAQTSAGM